MRVILLHLTASDIKSIMCAFNCLLRGHLAEKGDNSTESANHVAVIGCSEPGSGHWQDRHQDVLNRRIFCHSLIQTLS